MTRMLAGILIFATVMCAETIVLKPRGPLLILAVAVSMILVILSSCTLLGKKYPWLLKVADITSGLGIVSLLALAGAIAILSPLSSWHWWQQALLAGEVRGGISMAFSLVSGAIGLASLRFLVYKKYLQATLIFLIPGGFMAGLALSQPLCAIASIIVFLAAATWQIFRMAGTFAGLPKILTRLFCLGIPPLLLGVWTMTGAKGFEPIDALVESGFKQWVIKTVPALPAALAIPSWGSGREGARIDRVPVLSSEPVFTVWASPQTSWYLKIREAEILENQTWEPSKYRQVKKLNKPDDVLPGLNTPITTENSQAAGLIPLLVLRVDADYFPGIPRTKNTDMVMVNTTDPENPFNRKIINQSGYPDNEPLFPWKTQLQILSSKHQSENEIQADPAYLKECLVIPNELRTPLERFLLNFENTPATDEAYIRMIIAYFQTNYKYSIESTLGNIDINEFIPFLFETKKGWCSHFASALTLLARMRGIPARYVQGYTVIFGPRESQKIIPGTSAHAWTEIWFKDRGWVLFDATPGFNGLNGPALANDFKEIIPDSSSTVIVPIKMEIGLNSIVYLFSGIFILILSALITHNMLKSTKWWIVKIWNNLINKINKETKIEYNMMHNGLKKWSEYLITRHPKRAFTIKHLIKKAESIAWGNQPPTHKDLRIAKLILTLLKNERIDNR